MDDGYWPSFASDKARSTKAHWEQVGEGMIKELDFGRVWLRLNANDEGENEDVVAELKLDAKAFLDQCLVSDICFDWLTIS
jgi:Ca2+-dependent lipid-binding protein